MWTHLHGTKPVKKPKYIIGVIYIMSNIRDKYTFVASDDKKWQGIDKQRQFIKV